jgi:hypothetical protein
LLREDPVHLSTFDFVVCPLHVLSLVGRGALVSVGEGYRSLRSNRD